MAYMALRTGRAMVGGFGGGETCLKALVSGTRALVGGSWGRAHAITLTDTEGTAIRGGGFQSNFSGKGMSSGTAEEGVPTEEELGKEQVREIGNERVNRLADEIVTLNMLEISDLSALLKKKLGLEDIPMMPAMGMSAMGMGGMMPGAAGGSAEGGKEEEAKEEKTSFAIKLEGFDAASKIKVIKEVRAITSLGLKEAKEMVEGAPKVLTEGLSKEDAEALKVKLEEVGAKIVIE